jgi:RimJ/RimL family protein N-acetyltransferase
MADAAFILWLRNLDYVRGNVGDSAVDVAGQEAWLRTYFERENDYYFITESAGGIPLGTHGIYNVKGISGEKGRHIMRPEVMAGVPTGILSTDLAFERLALRELRAKVVITNVTVHSLLRKSGFKQIGIIPAAQMIAGKPMDMIEFLITAEDWFKNRDGQLPLARLAGVQVLEWEKAQLGKRQPWEEAKN